MIDKVEQSTLPTLSRFAEPLKTTHARGTAPSCRKDSVYLLALSLPYRVSGISMPKINFERKVRDGLHKQYRTGEAEHAIKRP